jgi:hypothetical protein
VINMNISLPFVTKSKRRKKVHSKEQTQRETVKVRSEYTPIEIQNMDMPKLEYLYQHGSPTERELADHLIQAKKKWALIELAMPMDSELASGSPFAGDRR